MLAVEELVRAIASISTLVLVLFGFACKPAPEPRPLPNVLEVAAHPDAALLSVGGRGPSEVWMVGARPTPQGGPLVLRGDGTTWEVLDTGSLHDLWWVHAIEGGSVWLGGAGATVLRYDGVGFARQLTPGFAGQVVFGVWGTSDDDVWAVGGFAGRDGFAWHFDGEAWTSVPLPDELPRTSEGEIPAILKVWGRASDDVWLVGGLGTILHWDGSALSLVPSGTQQQLFTVHGNANTVVAVGGAASGVLVRDDGEGFVDDTPPGAPLLQGVTVDDEGSVWVAGQYGRAWAKRRADWVELELDFAAEPQSVHGVWTDGEGGLWAVGGNVLTPALDAGVAATSAIVPSWEPEPVMPPVRVCPDAQVNPKPDGSMARRWSEQLLGAVRRDIPNPPVHARNLHHVAVAMYDAWVAYQDVAAPLVATEGPFLAAPPEDREIAIAYAAYRLLAHRYANAQNADISQDCFADFMALLGLDPSDTHTDGDDPIAVGNRIGQAVIDAFIDDGANESNAYADTTGWQPLNPVMVVDRPGTPVDDPNIWQQLNLAQAETQNGIVLDTTVQPYIGPQWREVVTFALVADPMTGLYSDPDPYPTVQDAAMADWVAEVIAKTAELDFEDGVLIDISPASVGNNTLGENDGQGYAENPVTGQPYAPVMVPRGDFTRVVAEMWADGPTSETPPGHWMKISNEVSDRLDPAQLRPFGAAEPVDRLTWDVWMYLSVTGATHDAAIAAWELKRDSLGPRPITLVRWMAQNGQRSDPDAPNYHPDGLPLVPGVIETITAESSAPGERHFDLRWHVGELAVWSWPGEPGDRANEHTSFRWMRAVDWIPYQRRTFVTPAFPGFVSGHSTFSRAAAEALTAYTGSPWFPDGLGEFCAAQDAYLVFENGPSVETCLQWASYYDAADQAGQSRLWGGIHIWPDDTNGRRIGASAGLATVARVQALLSGDAQWP